MKKNIEILKGYVKKIGNKRLLSLLVTCLLIMVFLGGTFALWDWKSTDAQKTEVVFTIGKPFTCSADVGGDVTSQGVPMVPTTCNDSSRAIKKKLTTTTTTIEALKDEDISIFMDLRLDINSIDSELSESKNLKYALTTSDNSCTDGVISSGTFYGLEANDKVDLLVNKEYSGNEERVYYLYIWLDAAETNINTAGKNFNFSINGECTDREPDRFVTFNPNGGQITGGTSVLYTTPGENEYVIPEDGSYTLEVWGAQGGNATSTYKGGYGGYSVGTISLYSGTTLYVNVGGQGSGGYPNEEIIGGYNGGGKVPASSEQSTNRYVASGGGASHIATKSGTLSSLSSNKDSILIVAGGGGGGYQHTAGGTHVGVGGDAGGYVGKNGSGTGYYGLGATQTTAGTAYNSTSTGVGGFGYGGDAGSQTHGSAGGGGWYGGGGSAATPSTGNSSGAGGSGYIGNSLLTNKSMYCYNCETSSDVNTLTYSTTNVSENPTSNYAKTGNGAVIITKLLNDKVVTNGSTYGDLPIPSRDGYTFIGWNTKADGTGNMISSETIVDLVDDQVLYAMWGTG